MSLGNIYNADTTQPFSGDALGGLQSAIETAYALDDAHYAKIVQIAMRSASPFTVRTNRENALEAVRMPSGEYGLQYTGGIDQLTFGQETTLTWMQAEWAYAAKVVFPEAYVWQQETVDVQDDGSGLVQIMNTDPSFSANGSESGLVSINSSSPLWYATDDGNGNVVMGG